MQQHRYLQNLERFILPAIVIATLAVFSPVTWHDFINYDDDIFVYENPNISSGLTIAAIRWAFANAYEVNWIPLSWMSHMLDIQLFGMNPGAHHLVNVILHAASSGILYAFLKRSTGDSWRSAAVALLFALHPLHVESVAWVAERKDVLSTFFGMLTLLMYHHYVGKPGAGRLLATVSLFLLGLLSKPMLVSLPIVLLLIDYWPLRRTSVCGEGEVSPWTRWLRLCVEKTPFLLLSICSSIITYRAQQLEGELAQGYTLASRAGKACIAYVTYLYKMVWPVDLAILYPFPKYPPTNLKIAACAVLLVAISAIVWLLRRHSPYMVTGWAWYIITLVPVIGLIQIGQHSIADRYTYVPLIGIFVMLVWGVPQILPNLNLRPVVLGWVYAAVLILMITLTSLQLKHWRNSYTLFSHTVAVTEENWVALNNLGLICLQNGKSDDAIRLFKESIKAKPSYALAHLNLGAAYLATTEYDKAVDSFIWALKFDGTTPKAHNGLAFAYAKLGRRDLALAEYRKLVEMGIPPRAEVVELLNSLPPGVPTR